MDYYAGIPSFDEAFDHVESASLLLGNGFSIELFGDRFDYRTLKQKAEHFMEPFTMAAFRNLDTMDFEHVMRIMDSTAKGLKIFGSEFDAEQRKLKAARENLKCALCRVISQIRPETPHEMETDFWDPLSHFLFNFENIFTTSYDLSLYWGIMKANEIWKQEHPGSYPRFRDGFSIHAEDSQTNLWGANSDYQNVHFLHGALHIFQEKKETKKIIKLRSCSDGRLVKKIKDRIEKDELPEFISEGTSEEKLERIKSQGNPYLDFAYSRLEDFQSSRLFTFGVSFANDNHLLDAIKANPYIEEVCMGVHRGDSPLLGKREFFQRQMNKPISYFRTKTVQLKDDANSYDNDRLSPTEPNRESW